MIWGIDMYFDFIVNLSKPLYFFIDILSVNFLFFLFNFIIYIKIFSSISRNLVFSTISYFTLFFYKNDLYFLLPSAYIYNKYIYIFDWDEGLWDLDDDHQKSRTVRHYNFLVYILKVFHNYFLLYFYIISLMYVVVNKNFSMNLLGSNKLNFQIIYIIYFYFYYIFIHKIFIFFTEFFYKSFWFNTNYS